MNIFLIYLYIVFMLVLTACFGAFLTFSVLNGEYAFSILNVIGFAVSGYLASIPFTQDV